MKLDRERVHFWSSNDMSYGRKLEKIETIDIPEYSRIDINDAIEFYEIRK